MGARAAIFVSVLGLTACQLESCKPQEAGSGIARLTTRTAGVLTRLVSNDTACGFASPAVLAAAQVEGKPGGVGTVTWTASDCALRFDGASPVLTNCDLVTTTAAGKVTVSGTKKVTGRLTGGVWIAAGAAS